MAIRNVFRQIMCALLATGIAVTAFAQSKNGVIKGIIKLSDGEPAAYIQVQLQGTQRGATTSENGNFIIRNVSPATYQVEVSLNGYQPVSQTITVSENATATVNIELALSEQQLEEVTVRTGRTGYKVSQLSPSLRLNESLLKTPQNIQVVTSQLLKDQQVFDMLEGVTRNVSGVTRVEHWDNYARINMRGSAIPSFRNGMNISMPWGPLTEDMSFVDRIEFVKGPAGFMMANGEPGGFYNVVTKKPTGINKREVNFTYGSYNTYRATADVDGKFTKNDKLLYRLNAMTEHKGSHRLFEYNDRYTIAPVITYNIDKRTSLTAEYVYQFSRMSAIGSAYVFSANKYGELPKNATIAEPNFPPTNINDHSATLTFNRQLGNNWQFTTQLAYLRFKQVGSSLWYDSVKTNGDLYRNTSIWDAIGRNQIAQVYVNGQVITGNITHKILAGVDAGKKNYWADWSQSAPLQGPEVFNIYHPVYGIPDNMLPNFDRSRSIKDRAEASYGIVNQSYMGYYVQDQLQLLNDKLRITLAGRYTTVNQNDYGTKYKGKKLTPRIGASYSIDKTTSVYGLYDQAFVPQAGYDSLKMRSFIPVTGNNIEFGFKRDWLDGRRNTTLAAYQIIKNNVATAVSGRPNAQTQLGQTKTQGVEFDLRGQLAKGLDVTLNYAYTDAKISKDNDKSVVGNPVAGSTKHITNGWLSYHILQGALKGVGIGAGYQYQVKRSSWFVFDNSAASLPDYFRMDGALSWQNDKLSVALNVNNLLNAYLYSGSPYAGAYYWQTEAPRNFRVSVGYKF